jgi:hypothetical protein
MPDKKTLKVKNIWNNDSGDVKIILLESLDPSRELNNDLFWYSGSERPRWSRGEELTDEQVLATRCYKSRTFTSIDQDIPNDCYMSF